MTREQEIAALLTFIKTGNVKKLPAQPADGIEGVRESHHKARLTIGCYQLNKHRAAQ